MRSEGLSHPAPARTPGWALLPLLLLVLTLVPPFPVEACPPTGGYVGVVLAQPSDLASAEAALSGLPLAVGVTDLSFPHLSGELRARALYLELGRWPNGTPLRGYLVPGGRYTLVLAETSSRMEDSWLRLTLAILAAAGVVDPSRAVSDYEATPNNEFPPAAAIRWAALELGVDLSGLRVFADCAAPSSSPSAAGERVGCAVAVVANRIDAELSYPKLAAVLRGAGVNPVLIPPSEAGDALLRYPVVIVLGGGLAEETGPVSASLLSREAERMIETSVSSQVVSFEYVGGVLVGVLAGSDRWGTQDAVGEFASGPWFHKVVEAAGG